MMMCSGLQTFIDGRNIVESNFIYQVRKFFLCVGVCGWFVKLFS